LDGKAVRCEADRCEEPALFLFVGAINGRWAYCEEHARTRARNQDLQIPNAAMAAFASFELQSHR
jgi:hypothetical protein